MRPDLDEVMRMLTTFGVEGDEWNRIMSIARDAQEHGWWERYADEMGPRQALCANLEAGAVDICQYQITLLPGLLQTPAYTNARIAADHDAYPPSFDPQRALEARVSRQRLLERPGGPRYHVVIDELAIRRAGAPTHVMAEQLHHIVDLASRRDTIAVRVLPIAASLPGDVVPRTAFTIYRYPDDPPVVLVDTITCDVIVTNHDQAARYEHLYKSLANAALAPAASLAFLTNVAEQIGPQPRIGVPA